MTKPTLCMISETIGPYNAIGRVSLNGVHVALEAGYQVTVVAQRLDDSLHDRVEWLKLYVPPRLFYVQWMTARRYMKQALGGRVFDVVHAHQPQAASMSDVFQCHFLTRMAYERNCIESRSGLKPALMRMQELGVLRAEDRCYRNWNPKTHMLFDSELTRQDFIRLYGRPPQEDVLVYAFPPFAPSTEEERRAARMALIGTAHQGPVVGFLGGANERKGYRRLIKAMEGDSDLFLLMGGSHCDGLEVPSLQGRFKALGLVSDTARFYAACDVFAVPSLYEPLGLVAFEAAARGTPVLATNEVGALPHLLEYGAGREWNPDQPLAPLVCEMIAQRAKSEAGAQRMAEDLCEARYGERLLQVYDEVLRSRRDGKGS